MLWYSQLFVLLLSVCVSGQFAQRIQDTQAALLADGPNLDVLNQYSSLIRDIEADNSKNSQLPQLYFKKSLIEINLSKEKLAIADLKKALALDANLRPAKEQLIDLLLETSSFHELLPYLDEARDQEVLDTIEKFNAAYVNVEALLAAAKYAEALPLIEDQLLTVAPLNTTLHNFHIECLKNLDDQDGFLSNTKRIIQGLGKLLKAEPNRNLQNYRHLSEYLLFTEASFEKAFNTIKQCVRIDNEFKQCIQVSKFMSKFSKVLTALETYSIELSHIYVEIENKQDASIDHSDLSEVIDFQAVIDFLLVEKPKLRGIPSGITTNYGYLVHLVEKFLKEQGLQTVTKSNIKVLSEVDKMICEAYIQTGTVDKSGHNFCKRTDDKFFPKYIPEIDKLLKERKYEKVEAFLNKFPPNIKQTQLYKSRFVQLGDFIRQREQRQRQAQQERMRQQQQQQQRQQQQYQQYQRQAAANSKPKNDYYKILDIPRDADDKTIKKAYRTQTLKYHPDKYKGNDLTPEQIEAKMQDINQAYEVLSDEGFRERYDRGDDPNDPTGGGGGPARANPFGGNPFGGNNFQFDFGGFNGGGFKFGGFGGQKTKFGGKRQ